MNILTYSQTKYFSDMLEKYFPITCTSDIEVSAITLKLRYDKNKIKIGKVLYKDGTPTTNSSDGEYVNIGWYPSTGGSVKITKGEEFIKVYFTPIVDLIEGEELKLEIDNYEYGVRIYNSSWSKIPDLILSSFIFEYDTDGVPISTTTTITGPTTTTTQQPPTTTTTTQQPPTTTTTTQQPTTTITTFEPYFPTLTSTPTPVPDTSVSEKKKFMGYVSQTYYSSCENCRYYTLGKCKIGNFKVAKTGKCSYYFPKV